ncbi:MAG TPA: M48 family metalloprotease [Flavobacteriaceae bacterium]|nr:M48 family metalloprotease [Flavobacteriaceae bacterium]
MSKNTPLTLSFFLICSFFTVITSAQQFYLIDSTDTEFKENLKQEYINRVKSQKKYFKKNLKPRKYRKEVIALYEDSTEDFVEKIEAGQFVSQPAYDNFLTDVLAQLSKSNPEYPEIKDTKILLSYGTTPNAYAIGDGIVVLYIPLIKKVQNQYELAFILSHEIAHNLLEHSKNSLLTHAELNTSKELKNKIKQLKREKYNRYAKARSIYKDFIYDYTEHSRAKEEQADSLGFVLFRNAYQPHAYEAINSLTFLDEIDKATDSLNDDDLQRYLSTPSSALRKELLKNNELAQYNYNDEISVFWNVDSLKTHKDCSIRAGVLQSQFNIEKDSVSLASAEFITLQQSSAFNDLLGLYQIEEYGYSLYQSFLLLKQYPANPYIREVIYKNLDKIISAKRAYRLNDYVQRPSPSAPPSYNTFLYAINNLRLKELNQLKDFYKN